MNAFALFHFTNLLLYSINLCFKVKNYDLKYDLRFQDFSVSGLYSVNKFKQNLKENEMLSAVTVQLHCYSMFRTQSEMIGQQVKGLPTVYMS